MCPTEMALDCAAMGASGLVISVSGIRGIVGQSLTPEVVATYAAAHGAAAAARSGRSTIVLGRDARVSGPFLAAAAEAGLRSVGCDVLDVGMACTPTILLAVEDAEYLRAFYQRLPKTLGNLLESYILKVQEMAETDAERGRRLQDRILRNVQEMAKTGSISGRYAELEFAFHAQ